MNDAERKCRICGGGPPRLLGRVEYFSGFPSDIYDCPACGCRFTDHDSSVYEKLHAMGAISYYADYQDLAAKCASLFQQRNETGLKELLFQNHKYRFIIEKIEKLPAEARLLEVGCSRGYLTAYFILTGRHITGVDASPTAVSSAQRAFGDHFVQADSPAIREVAPYDVIYHLGMIGCVADPIDLTRGLLAMLRPGGKLLFNAPNVSSCYLRRQLWLDSAPPPDLVTLFPSGFWVGRFGTVAEVNESITMRSANDSMRVGLGKLLGRRWKMPVPTRGLEGRSGETCSSVASPLIERALLKIARTTHLNRLASRQPSEFGLYVEMIAKQGSNLSAKNGQ